MLQFNATSETYTAPSGDNLVFNTLTSTAVPVSVSADTGVVILNYASQTADTRLRASFQQSTYYDSQTVTHTVRTKGADTAVLVRRQRSGSADTRLSAATLRQPGIDTNTAVHTAKRAHGLSLIHI